MWSAVTGGIVRVMCTGACSASRTGGGGGTIASFKLKGGIEVEIGRGRKEEEQMIIHTSGTQKYTHTQT